MLNYSPYYYTCMELNSTMLNYSPYYYTCMELFIQRSCHGAEQSLGKSVKLKWAELTYKASKYNKTLIHNTRDKQ